MIKAGINALSKIYFVDRFCKSCEAEKSFISFDWNNYHTTKHYDCKECRKEARALARRLSRQHQKTVDVNKLVCMKWKQN